VARAPVSAGALRGVGLDRRDVDERGDETDLCRSLFGEAVVSVMCCGDSARMSSASTVIRERACLHCSRRRRGGGA